MHANDRLHALDAVRAYALLLGIALHAATPWLKDVDVWPVREEPAAALAVVWYVIHMFRMQAFYLIAGFFGRMVLEKRGMQAFIKDRAKRIALPFVVGLPSVSILMALMYVAGTLISGHSLADLLASVQPQQDPSQAPRQGTGPNAGPLWFLYYLIMFYAATLLLRSGVKRINGKLMEAVDATVKFLMGGVWGPVLLGLAFSAWYYHQSTWSSWTGMSGPRSFIPNGSLLSYWIVFGLGWLLHRQKDLLLQLEKTWLPYCMLATALALASLWLGGTTPHWGPYLHGTDLMVYSTTYMIGVWFGVFGLIGAALHFLSGENAVRRYLADASYWMYLLHVPLLLFIHAVLQTTHWHWSIEYLLSMAFVLPILLLSYHYLVRPTFIGATLNGKKHPR